MDSNKGDRMNSYGIEVIVDLHECNPVRFTRKCIRDYFKDLCELIDMEPCKLCWWDDLHTPPEDKEIEPHLVGTSAVQFIKTSNITIHTLDIMKRVYVNIFSCKDFDPQSAIKFTEQWFEGKLVSQYILERQ